MSAEVGVSYVCLRKFYSQKKICMVWFVLFTVDTHLSYLLKYDNRFFCSRYFWFLVFVRQPNKYTVENRYKPTGRRFVPEKMTK